MISSSKDVVFDGELEFIPDAVNGPGGSSTVLFTIVQTAELGNGITFLFILNTIHPRSNPLSTAADQAHN